MNEFIHVHFTVSLGFVTWRIFHASMKCTQNAQLLKSKCIEMIEHLVEMLYVNVKSI